MRPPCEFGRSSGGASGWKPVFPTAPELLPLNFPTGAPIIVRTVPPLTATQTIDRARAALKSGRGAGLPELLKLIETLTTNLKVNLYIPGQVHTRMLSSAMPGKDMTDVTKPEDVAEKIIDLCLPSLTHTGRYYSYKTGTFMDFQAPA